jgi:hypothetical protein
MRIMKPAALSCVLVLISAAADAQPRQKVAAPPTRSHVEAPSAGAAEDLARGLHPEVEKLVIDAFRIVRGPREEASERRARAIFESVSRTDTHGVVGRLGLGLLDAREALDPASYRGGIAGTTAAALYAAGTSPAHHARIHLHAALQYPHTMAAAAAALVQLELLVRDEASMRRLHGALEQVPSDAPALRRARLELANAIGELNAVPVVANDVCSDAQLLRAEAENMLRRSTSQEGVRVYHRAVECMTDEDTERFYADVMLLLTPAERTQWEGGSLADKRTLLQNAWKWRAAQTGFTEAERLAEHFRRLAHANNAYSFYPPSMNAMGDTGVSINPQQSLAMGMLDQRAQLFVRHGAPDRVIISTPGAGAPSTGPRAASQTSSNESWVYTQGGERLVLHFSSTGEKFVLGGPRGCVDVTWLEERTSIDQRFGLMAHRCRNPGGGGALMNSMTLRDIQSELRAEYRTALATESQRQFVRPLRFAFELYRFAGEDGMTDVVAALAVPASDLPQPENVGGEVQYRIGTSLIMMDTLTRAVQRIDTVLTLRTARALLAGEVARLHVTLAATPSQTTVFRVVARNPDDAANGGGYGGPLEITRFAGDSLEISDLVLAEPQAVGSWRRGAHQLALVPFQEFPGGEFDLFYELYGASPGARLQTEITLAPRSGGLFGIGRGRPVELRFSHVAAPGADGVLQERRRIDASTGPGEYQLTVTVRDLDSGAVTRQERRFRVTR